MDRAKQLIKLVQQNKATPMEQKELIAMFKAKYRPHRHDNYLYDQDELEQEYLVACWNAAYRAKLDVGNPIMFCVNRGNGAMLDYYRAVSSQKLVLKCECGHTMAYDRRNTKCHKCGSAELDGVEKEDVLADADVIPAHNQPQDTESKVLEQLLAYVRSADMEPDMKRIAVNALKYRVTFKEEAVMAGYDQHKAMSFHNRLVVMLKREFSIVFS